MSGALRSFLTSLTSAIVVAGLGLSILLMPWAVRAAVRAARAPALVELGERTALDAAEAARLAVTRGGIDLPASLGGRLAFEAQTAAHLQDVRKLIAAARWLTIAALVSLWCLVAHAVAHGTQRELARGLRWGGRALLAASTAAALGGVFDFSAAFVAFHRVLFPQGGWVFPSDALIIRLFPERFWMLVGGLWVVLCATGAAVLLLAARFVLSLRKDLPADTVAPFGD